MMDGQFFDEEAFLEEARAWKPDPEEEKRRLMAALDKIGPQRSLAAPTESPQEEEIEQTTAPKPSVQRIARFSIEEHGVFMESQDGDPVFVCSPLEVVATYASASGRGWGKLIRLQSANGNMLSLRIDNAELQSAASKVLAKLADSGLELGTDKKAKDYVIQLLKLWKPERHLLSVPQVGWTSSAHNTFFLGNAAVGQVEVLPPEASREAQPSGRWEDWRDKVGKLCVGNPMMVLAASLAFSGPLLSICGMSGGGLHFRGASSSGKTTLLAIANSVWADRKSIRQWRGTSNGLEVLAQRSNDMLLALDELAEIQARDLSGTIYMLANGVPKVRMGKDINLQEGPSWRLALISSGEISVAQKLREAGAQVMAGHDVRLIDIEADSRRYGVFDDLHGCRHGAEMADKVQTATCVSYGSVGRRFVEMVIKELPKIQKILAASDQRVSKWKAQLPADVDGQVMRVAQRFALIGLAGQLATKFGLTGWSLEVAEEAAEAAFLDWYDRIHGDKQDAASEALLRLQSYLSVNANLVQVIGGEGPAVAAPEAWQDTSRLYILPEVWSRIMAGLDEKTVGKALVDVGILQRGDGERLMRKAPRSIAGRPRLYTVNMDRMGSSNDK